MGDYDRWKSVLQGSFEQFMETLGSYLPSLIGALLLTVIGFFLAVIIRWLIMRLGQGIDNLFQRLGLRPQNLFLNWPLSRIIANVAYWLIILFFVTAAAESLGLPGIAEWLGRFMVYLPSILIALLIVWLGFALGAWTRDWITLTFHGTSVHNVEQVATVARLLVIALTIVIGLEQLGIDVSLLENLFVIIVAAVILALALAFGLGAGPMVGNLLASRNLKKHYVKGQHIKIGDIEGEILEMSRTAVILETDSGRSMVPAAKFQEQASTLLDSND